MWTPLEIGLAVSAALMLPILSVLSCCAYRWYRRRKENSSESQEDEYLLTTSQPKLKKDWSSEVEFYLSIISLDSVTDDEGNTMISIKYEDERTISLIDNNKSLARISMSFKFSKFQFGEIITPDVPSITLKMHRDKPNIYYTVNGEDFVFTVEGDFTKKEYKVIHSGGVIAQIFSRKLIDKSKYCVKIFESGESNRNNNQKIIIISSVIGIHKSLS
eukprot:TRINITY_DN253_c0_g1_i1.p1 TRINITY_DN253_c0_g1~~TRINITY_DN253_c0_g1_i1.p1  ORF type:complete len:217 (-),score=28.50 TRINITY_DN253_c0_g1_i1:152-802(-)